MKKILVLGSEGFLGSVLVPYLLKDKNIRIIGIDECFFGKNNKKNKNFKFYKKRFKKRLFIFSKIT